MSRKASKATPVDLLRKVARQQENKVCADCPERLPQYVNSTHLTFVCTSCSGVHRNFSHRIKGISMCEFTMEEVTAIKERGGNDRANKKYLARYDKRTAMAYPMPTVSTPSNKLKDFIKKKYLDKAWWEVRPPSCRQPQ